MRREGFVETNDGIRVWYGLTGPDLGSRQPTMVLCDGIACDGFIWPHIIDHFESRVPILRWHYRGHGRSEAPPGDDGLRLEMLAQDLRQLSDVLDIEQPVVVGHSMGVQVALEFFRQNPRRTSGLGLFCGSYGNPLATFQGTDLGEKVLPWFRSMIERAPRLAGAVWSRLLPTGLSFWLAQLTEIHRERAARADFFPYLEHVARMDLRVFLGMLTHAAKHTARDVLDRVDVPTLIVAGGEDGFTPPELSSEMAARIQGSDLLMLAEGTHTAPIEFPAQINERLENLLATVRER